MLKLYDYLDTLFQLNKKTDSFPENAPLLFANDILEELQISDDSEKSEALKRAIQNCLTLGIPLSKNFKRVYRFTNEGIIQDWQTSPLAGYLIIINCSPKHEYVAKAQLFFAIKGIK